MKQDKNTKSQGKSPWSKLVGQLKKNQNHRNWLGRKKIGKTRKESTSVPGLPQIPP